MIEDSLQKRKHVWHYDEEIIPTKEEVEEILRIGYSLSSSKQKAYAYKFWVLGPDKKRSEILYQIAEGKKIDLDFEAYGTTVDSENYIANVGLMHLRSAPYTFIITPRQANPNPYYKYWFERTKSLWQCGDHKFCDTSNRESNGVEVGIAITAITGAALDRGWDVAYNSCFKRDRKVWPESFPYISGERGFAPVVIMTLGKARKYYYERLEENGFWAKDPKLNIDPPFETIFEFV